MKVLEDVIELLKGSEVNMIGVYGMGTVVKEVKLFDKVFMAEVTLNPELKTIQDKVAYCWMATLKMMIKCMALFMLLLYQLQQNCICLTFKVMFILYHLEFFTSGTTRFIFGSFWNLKSLDVWYYGKLMNASPLNLMVRLERLDHLKLDECDSIDKKRNRWLVIHN